METLIMDDYQVAQPTRSLADMLKGREMKFKKVRQLNPRQERINAMCSALNIENKWRKGLYFQCMNITDQELEFIFTKALSFKPNPPAYFRTLIKKKLQELKSIV